MLFSSPCNVESGKRNRRVKVTSCVEKGMDIKMVRGMKLQKDQISSVLGFAAVPAELYPTYHHQNLDSSWNGAIKLASYSVQRRTVNALRLDKFKLTGGVPMLSLVLHRNTA